MSEEEKAVIIISGSFNVPYIFPVKIIEEDLKISEILNQNLPKYKRGNINNPGEGYKIKEDIELTGLLKKNPPLADIFNELIIINFYYDVFGNKKELIDGEIQLKKEFRTVGINNIFWIYPDYLIIKGSQETGKRFKKSFQNIFKKKIMIQDYYTFDPWFIKWIIWKYRTKNYEIDKNFYVDIIWDLKVEGSEPTNIGRIITAEESTDVTKSISILYPLLKGLTPKKFKFSFSIDKLIGTIKIITDGRMLVYLTKGSLAEKCQTDQVVISCFFIKRIIEIYKKWQELPGPQKIPPPDFIRDIVKECDEMGFEITTDVMSTVEMYKNKLKEEIRKNG